jgi:type IV pilus assembly protein PilC
MATATAAKPNPRVTQAAAARASTQLTNYQWVGKDKRGAVMKGETSARNQALVKANLRQQGITVTSVTERKKRTSAGRRITAQEISIFSRQLATMMQSGVPVVQGFDIVASGAANPRMQNMLMDIKQTIEGGSTLAEALGKYPVQFDELYLNLVRAGEAAGVLDTILDTIATYKENIEALKGKIKKALYYPTVVMAVAFMVSCLLLIFVIPQFQSIFSSFGADLPAFTKMLVSMSEFMQSYWWLVGLVIGGSIFGAIEAKKRSHKFAHFLDRMVLKLPVIGQIMHQSAIARFARTLSLTFKAGVPLVEALDTVSGATGNVVYNEAVKRIREDVAVGHQLQLAMKQVNIFPNMVVQMTAIGEESGALDTMLLKVAQFYEQEVNNAVDALASLLEPFIMVIIGVIVGGMVVGMYLPIFKLAAVM